MKLTDMKYDADERDKRDNEIAAMPKDTPSYPYGLSITLDQDALEKLGITSLPKVGSELVLHAHGRVKSVSQNESDHETHRDVGIQIEQLTVEQLDLENVSGEDFLAARLGRAR